MSGFKITMLLRRHPAIAVGLLSWLLLAPVAQAETLSFTVTEAGEDQQTLGDLKPAFIDFSSKGIPKIPAQEVVRRYLDLIKSADDPELRIRVLARLANLEALYADQKPDGLLDNELWQVAIESYQAVLAKNPHRADADELYYQLAHAYDMKADQQDSLNSLRKLVNSYPKSSHYLEAQFRIGEAQYSLGQYVDAEKAYRVVLQKGQSSAFYDKAQYMLGWSLFKQERYNDALTQFVTVLDSFHAKSEDSLNKIDHDQMDDALRIMSVVFASSGGADEVARLIQRSNRPQYASLLYGKLTDLYLKNQRYQDAANTADAFVQRYPNDPKAPMFAVQRINAFQAGNFPSLVWPEKERFVKKFGIYSAFWKAQDEKQQAEISPYLKGYLDELSRLHYVNGQKAKGAEANQEFLVAAGYFRQFVEAFPADESSGEKYFLMGEALVNAGDYANAIPAYEHAAYDYQTFKKRADSAYAALVAYDHEIQIAPAEQRDDWRHRRIQSIQKFASQFPDNDKVAQLVLLAANEQLSFNQYQNAMTSAQQITSAPQHVDNDILRGAWLAEANAAFALLQYEQAEYAFKEALKRWGKADSERNDVEEKLAASIYKQAELALTQNRQEDAINNFLRVGAVVPGASIRANAQYDAGMKLLEAKQWPRAIQVLEDFRKQFPQNELTKGIGEKLVYAYQQNNQPARAAQELLQIAKADPDAETRRKALLQGADLLSQAGQVDAAAAAYQDYAQAYPRPLDTAMEVAQKLVDIAVKRGDMKARNQWLAALVKLDADAGDARTDRSRYLAASASWQFAQDEKANFDAIKLTLPLKQSLAQKRAALDKVLAELKRTNNYGVGEFATAATYLTGEVYRELSKDLLASERPSKLSDLEKEQYGLLLEEQAYPFEEKAIQFFELNTKRARDGIYDKWVQESFVALSKMVPARYAKDEKRVDVVSTLH